LAKKKKEMTTAPLSDEIIFALSRLVDDAQVKTREPSHSDIEFQVNLSKLSVGDPKQQGQVVGKAKRLRSTLSWALEHNTSAGEEIVERIVATVRACGGFRPGSPNFVGEQPVKDLINAFGAQGYELSSDGELRPFVLDNLSGAALTEALKAYARRAKRGVSDTALLTGTAKDFVEATAAHVLTCRFGRYPEHTNFPTLLGQAFISLGLATPQDSPPPNEPPQRDVQRAMYTLACKINKLRNREGSGHGRPWLPSVTDAEAKTSLELMGCIAEFMLAALT